MKKLNKLLSIPMMFVGLAAQSQDLSTHDRVYAANQVSNTVSVVDPATNTFLGEINLGKPYPNVLSPLYRGQSLVHGLRYSQARKMLAVVSIGSNSVTLISTETNKVLKTIYVGRSPHEPTFTPDNKQLWVSIRGESYISVIDLDRLAEVKRVPVADGPGMVSFSQDGQLAYICSSFTAELDIVNTNNYEIVKKIPVVSPFSPNIFTSPKGEWVAMTHKDVGKVTIISTASQKVIKVLSTGAITNHVSFSYLNQKLLMSVTVGGENLVKIFDVAHDFKQMDSIKVGALPHGLWPSPNGRFMYVGLEYGDQVQGIDMETMTVSEPIKIGQSPQALVYAADAVTSTKGLTNLSPLNDLEATNVVIMKGQGKYSKALARLAFRPIGLTDLVEQIYSALLPSTAYTLVMTKSKTTPYTLDYEINSFTTDANGKYAGQSTGLVRSQELTSGEVDFAHIILIDKISGQTVLLN